MTSAKSHSRGSGREARSSLTPAWLEVLGFAQPPPVRVEDRARLPPRATVFLCPRCPRGGEFRRLSQPQGQGSGPQPRCSPRLSPSPSLSLLGLPGLPTGQLQLRRCVFSAWEPQDRGVQRVSASSALGEKGLFQASLLGSQTPIRVFTGPSLCRFQNPNSLFS